MKKLTLLILTFFVFTILLSGCNHTHKFGEWIIVKKATCTEEGVQERLCTCGEKQMQTIPATGHMFDNWTTTKEATCTEDGAKERLCACGEKEIQAIPAKGHSFGNRTIVKEATCIEDGVEEQVCTCGEKRSQVISAGHDWKAATCTASKTCKQCGATEGAALGHNYRNGFCTRCGEKAGATFFMPYVGNSYTYYYSSGEVCSICQITWIDTPRVQSDYDPQKMGYTVKVAMTSTYNAKGNNYSSAPKVGYKVYDVNGVIVKSGTIYGENIAVGETCYAEFLVYYVEVGHTYTIEFSNVQG